MRPGVRLAVLAISVVGLAIVPRVAFAQGVTDDAHALCAQGGANGGPGGVGGNDGGTTSDASDNGQPGNGAQGGAGGGGVMGGLGGNTDVGGGAGGCIPEETPVPTLVPIRVIRQVVVPVEVRRLPTTGSSANHVAAMGGGMLALGGLFVAGAWMAYRRRVGESPADLVWDAFGWRSG